MLSTHCHQAVTVLLNTSATQRMISPNSTSCEIYTSWPYHLTLPLQRNSPNSLVFSDKPINTEQRGGSLCERVRGRLTAFYQGGLISVCLISWEMYGNWTVRGGTKSDNLDETIWGTSDVKAHAYPSHTNSPVYYCTQTAANSYTACPNAYASRSLLH